MEYLLFTKYIYGIFAMLQCSYNHKNIDFESFIYQLYYRNIENFSQNNYIEFKKEIKNANTTIKRFSYSLVDYKGFFYNAFNGCRITTNQPKQFEHSIYLLGPSHCFGLAVPDNYTIASCLQRILNKISPEYWCVFNYGIPGTFLHNAYLLIKTLLSQRKLLSGDCVLFLDARRSHLQSDYKIIVLGMRQYCQQNGIDFHTFMWPRVYEILNPSPLEKKLTLHSLKNIYNSVNRQTRPTPVKNISSLPSAPNREKNKADLLVYPWFHDLQSHIERPHKYGEIVMDRHCHLGPHGNELIADVLFNILEKDSQRERERERERE